MSLKGIISISGKGGLFKVIGQGKNSVIVESIENGRKFPAFSSNKISALSDISIYTEDDDVLLQEVYKTFQAKLGDAEALGHKDNMDDLKKFLGEVFPEYDKERVTNTDIKKLFQWYNMLHKADLLNFEEDKGGDSEEE